MSTKSCHTKENYRIVRENQNYDIYKVGIEIIASLSQFRPFCEFTSPIWDHDYKKVRNIRIKSQKSGLKSHAYDKIS